MRRGQPYTLRGTAEVDYAALLTGAESYRWLLPAMGFSLLLLLFTFRFFRQRISQPVQVLMEGAAHIRQGELGYQIDTGTGSPQVRLAEEMTYVNAYLYIVKERFGKRLAVDTDIPRELMDCLVPRLILQPVIENAVEHGIGPSGQGQVALRGFREGERLILEIENNGGAVPPGRGAHRPPPPVWS